MSRPTSDLAINAADNPDRGSRRTRLREFQVQLVERMHAVSSGAQMHAAQLGVAVGNTRWLLNLQEAGEIISVGAITKVPLTQDWFLGLTSIRGNLTNVIDLARFLGEPSIPIEKDSRIVAFAPGLSFNCGLLVSRVMGLRNVADMELRDESNSGQPSWASRQYVDRDSRIWTELNLSLLVQDPHFLQVSAW